MNDRGFRRSSYQPQFTMTITNTKSQTILEKRQDDNLEKLKLYLNFGKFLASLFFGTVLGTFLTWYINYKEVQIQEKESKLELQLNERQELAKYFQYTMEGDVYDRLKLSMFFRKVLTDEESRKLWESYSTEQEEMLDKYQKVTQELKEIEIQLEDKTLKKEEKSNLERDKLDKLDLQQKLIELIDPVKVEIRSVSTDNTESFEFDLGLLDKPIIEGGSLTWNHATKNGERIPPSRDIFENIIRMAKEMEDMKRVLFPNNKIIITSWYRDPDTNRKLGGPARSNHLLGHGLTFHVQDIPIYEVYKKVEPYWGDRGGVGDGRRKGFVFLDLRGTSVRWIH